jgi:hypothetical protein
MTRWSIRSLTSELRIDGKTPGGEPEVSLAGEPYAMGVVSNEERRLEG